MTRQMACFVVGVRFGLKKDGFAWECLQKVKKMSSDMLGFEKCGVKTYIFRTWCPEGVSSMISLYCYIANMGCLRANMGCLRANRGLSQSQRGLS